MPKYPRYTDDGLYEAGPPDPHGLTKLVLWMVMWFFIIWGLTIFFTWIFDLIEVIFGF